MLSRQPFTRSLLTVIAASGALVIASCGDDADYGFGKLFPVSGHVTYNDKPLEKGQIIFTSEDTKNGVGATGVIENGSFVIGTAGDKNGARPGKYKVVIISKEDSESVAKAAFEKDMAKHPELTKNLATGRIPREFMNKAAQEAKSFIPAGYGDLRTTTLTADVKEGPNTIEFKLSDADAPPEPPKNSGKGKGRRK